MAETNDRFAPQVVGDEQQALQQSLESQELGGAAAITGSLGAGADVPTVLEGDPAIRQLLQEEIYRRSGQTDKAVASSEAYGATPYGRTEAGGGAVSPEDRYTGVTDSSAADAEMDDLTGRMTVLESEIVEETGTGTGIEQPEFIEPSDADAQDLIEYQQQQVAANLEANLKAISDLYSARIFDQRQINLSRLGATRNLLAATGSSTFASGQGAITREVQRGAQAIAELTALQQQAIASARSAAADQNIDLLKESIDAAEKARAAKNEIRQQQFNNFITALQESRSADEYEFNKATSIINTIGTLSPDTFGDMDQAALQALESSAGLPDGFLDAFVKTQTAVAQAEASEDLFAKSKDLLELAMDLPHGTQFEVGDFVVTGLDIGDRKVFENTDDAGNVTYTTIDPATGGLINVVTVPGIEKITQPARTGGGSGSGGDSGTALSREAADYLSWAIGQIGQEVNGAVVTTQDVLNGALRLPSVLNDADSQEQIIDMLSSLDDLGPSSDGSYHFIEKTYNEGEEDEVTVVRGYNKDTGLASENVFTIEEPPVPEGESSEKDKTTIGDIVTDFYNLFTGQ